LHAEFRCEDLASPTFADGSFDLVIAQDVLEHLLQPIHSMREICRTLKPGGAHLFAVPWYHWKPTKVIARSGLHGVEHLEAPEYHINPVDDKRALVVTEWCKDLCETIARSWGMPTAVHRIHDRRQGIEAEFIEVFVSTKPGEEGRLLDRWDPLASQPSL